MSSHSAMFLADAFKVEMYHMIQYCNIKSKICKPNIFTKAATQTIITLFLDIILKNAEQDESSVLLFYYDQT